MTDIAELVKERRECGVDECDRAADTIESQARELSELTAKYEARGQQYLEREVEMARLRAKVEALTERLVDNANEEPPTGWLRPGEDGYENTPQGARDQRDAALADVLRLEGVVRDMNDNALTAEREARAQGRREGLEEAANLYTDGSVQARSIRALIAKPPEPPSECTCYDCACRVCKRHNTEFCPVHGQPKPAPVPCECCGGVGAHVGVCGNAKPPPHAPDDAPTGATLLPGARRAVVRRR